MWYQGYIYLEIKDLVHNHFVNLQTSELEHCLLHPPRPLSFPCLASDIVTSIQAALTKAEVEDSRKQLYFLSLIKPLDLMVSTPSSSKNFRTIYNLVLKVFSQKKVPKELNSTLLYLIPKVGRPEIVNQFRPARLCNTLYKTITNFFVNRLRLYVPW